MVKKNISMAAWSAAAFLLGNASSHADNTDDLSQYKWKNRLLIVIGERGSPIFRQVQEFQTANICEFRDRKLLLKMVIKDSKSWNILPTVLKQKNGLFLIGLDGGMKGYSPDKKLLESLNSQIDSMPMRRQELSQFNSNATCVD